MVPLGHSRSRLAWFRQIQTTSAQIEDPLRRIAIHAPGVVCQFHWHLDGSLTIPFITPNSRKLFGLSAAEIQADAQKLLQLIHVKDRASFHDSFERSIQALQPWYWQGHVIALTGQARWLRLAAEPDLQSNGEIVWNGFLISMPPRCSAAAID